MARTASRRRQLEWSELRVGLFLIIGLALLGYAVYRVGDLFDVFADRYPLVMLVPAAAGLLEGAPVTLAGQRVGQVDAIDFLPVGAAEPNHLSIRLSISQEVQAQIRADSRARIRTQGLLGDRYVDISPGTPGAPVLSPGDTIPAIPPVDYEDLLASAAETLEEARQLVTELRAVTDGLLAGRGTLGRLLTDEALYDRMVGATGELRTLLAGINGADGTLGRLIRDPALYERIHGAVARIDSLGALILHGDGTLGRLVRDDDLYRQLTGVVGHADSTITSLGASLGALTDGEGTLQRFLTDPALYDEFLKAVIDLQTLINDIRANPKKYRPEVNVDVF
ncbi:MAG TPA: MlaD family protein [Longimicrobiales bacterium]